MTLADEARDALSPKRPQHLLTPAELERWRDDAQLSLLLLWLSERDGDAYSGDVEQPR